MPGRPWLTLTYEAEPDNPTIGLLKAKASAGSFSGAGKAYFNRSEIEDNFTRRLLSFPIKEECVPRLEGGIWRNGELEKVIFSIVLAPFGASGRISVKVFFVEDNSADLSAGHSGSMKLEFLTDYSELPEFASELIAVLDERGDEANLNGR